MPRSCKRYLENSKSFYDSLEALEILKFREGEKVYRLVKLVRKFYESSNSS